MGLEKVISFYINFLKPKIKKTKIKMKAFCFIIILLGFTEIGNSQVTITGTNLRIINNRSCPVTVNWEVSNCFNCPNSGCQYCNSISQVGSSPPTFIIPASGQPGSTFVVDISTQWSGTGAGDCSIYNTNVGTNTWDVFVGLFELDGIPPSGGGIYGGVACGCNPGACFSSTTTDTGSPGAGSCSGTWNMSWTNTTSGIDVVIW